MSDARTRAKKLDSFNRTFSNMLENEMAEHKRVLRQKYSHLSLEIYKINVV
jgi:hypothetical protein